MVMFMSKFSLVAKACSNSVRSKDELASRGIPTTNLAALTSCRCQCAHSWVIG